MKFGDGSIYILLQQIGEKGKAEQWQQIVYSEKFACVDHPEASLAEISPRVVEL